MGLLRKPVRSRSWENSPLGHPLRTALTAIEAVQAGALKRRLGFSPGAPAGCYVPGLFSA